MTSQQNAVMWRGAKLGAVLGGSSGFIFGMAVCIIFKLPIPPLFVTEMGLLLGACMGAGLALAWDSPVGRRTLLGLLSGFALGLPLTLGAHLVRGAWDPLIWLGCLVLGGFLGYQRGLSPPQGRESWRLLR